MERSTKAAWLEGGGDLAEDEVLDVPVKGQSVRVRALSARFSADAQSQMKLVTEGREQVARLDVAAMERLQFQHGVIDPVFDAAEVAAIQEMYGAAFRKVIARIDEISGIDKEAIRETEERFPPGGEDAAGSAGSNGRSGGGAGPDLDLRTGPVAADVGD